MGTDNTEQEYQISITPSSCSEDAVVTTDGNKLFVDDSFILTLAEGVRIDAFISPEKEARKIDVDKELAFLAVNFVRLMDRVKYLESRECWLTEELECIRDEFERVSIGQVLKEARDSDNSKKIIEAEKSLDDLTWPIFDSDYKLQFPGGHYVLQNVIDDILSLRRNIDRCDIVVDLDEIVDSATRWCQSRSKWWFNTRCWIETVGQYIIIKRNRFAFQVKIDDQTITNDIEGDN